MVAHAYSNAIESRLLRRYLLALRFAASTLWPHAPSLRAAAVETRRLGAAQLKVIVKSA